MKVWTSNDFPGVEPTGTAAVIVAPDEATARAMLRKRLIENRVITRDRGEPFTVVELATDAPCVQILCDGDYR